MEKTINEITSSIINTVRPQLKDDDWIDERDVIEWVNDQRNEYGRQVLSKNPLSINTNFLQTERIEMKVVDNTINPHFDADSTVLMSKNKIPTILNKRGEEPAINTISSDHILGFSYRYVPSNSIISYLNSSREFNKESILVTFAGEYIVLISKSNYTTNAIKYINLQAFFSNPLEVSTFNKKTDIYPLPGNLRPSIEKKIIQEKYGLKIQNYSDQDNNSTHELKPDMNGNGKG